MYNKVKIFKPITEFLSKFSSSLIGRFSMIVFLFSLNLFGLFAKNFVWGFLHNSLKLITLKLEFFSVCLAVLIAFLLIFICLVGFLRVFL